jgi:rSAM/selenodomain-associated transferase 2
MELSVIIPTFNEEHHIKILLQRLSAYKDIEILVVDGGSMDRTLEEVSSFEQVKIISSKKGRATQMNTGADQANGRILLFLHADTFPPEAFDKHIGSVMHESDFIGGSFYLEFDRVHPLLRLYSLFSRINHTLFTYGDQAIFIRKTMFKRIGGFASIPIMEDLEIQKRMRRSGKFIKLDLPVITSARKFSRDGMFWNQVKNILLVLFYLLGVSPDKLAKHY